MFFWRCSCYWILKGIFWLQIQVDTFLSSLKSDIDQRCTQVFSLLSTLNSDSLPRRINSSRQSSQYTIHVSGMRHDAFELMTITSLICLMTLWDTVALWCSNGEFQPTKSILKPDWQSMPCNLWARQSRFRKCCPIQAAALRQKPFI